MGDPRKGYRPHPRRDYRRTSTARPQPTDPSCPGQQTIYDFLDPIAPRAQRYGFGDPPSQTFAASVDRRLLEHAARHGWSARQTDKTRIALRVAQAKHTITCGRFKASHVAALADHDLAVRTTLAFLAACDLLDEDRVPDLPV